MPLLVLFVSRRRAPRATAGGAAAWVVEVCGSWSSAGLVEDERVGGARAADGISATASSRRRGSGRRCSAGEDGRGGRGGGGGGEGEPARGIDERGLREGFLFGAGPLVRKLLWEGKIVR
jgi:hypothetical protein